MIKRKIFLISQFFNFLIDRRHCNYFLLITRLSIVPTRSHYKIFFSLLTNTQILRRNISFRTEHRLLLIGGCEINKTSNQKKE